MITKYDVFSEEKFLKYFYNFYNGNYFIDVFGVKLTKNIIKKYLPEFIKKRLELNMWGGGDSFDREVFRDYLLYKLNILPLNQLEFTELVKKHLSDVELDAIKYNL